MRSPLLVAAAQPSCTAQDLAANARGHADAVRSAAARLVVFPELSLTGYELDVAPVSCRDQALLPILEACGSTGSLALVGAPVADREGRVFIAMLRIDAHGVQVVHRKSWLGAAEAERFAPGEGPSVIDLDGWRLGLGICKETGAAQHTAATARLGVDAYLAGLVHRPDELSELEARAVVIARACRAWVVFASFAGPTGGGYPATAGCSGVWSPDGVAVARSGTEPGELVRACLPGQDGGSSGVTS